MESELDSSPGDQRRLDENISLRREPGVPGVEVLNAENTERCWRWLHTAFSIAVPTTWVGKARYRRQLLGVGPGTAFCSALCSAPGEIHTTPVVHERGTFHALLFDADLFQTLMQMLGSRCVEVTWGSMAATASPGLRARALWLAQNLGDRHLR